jgi:two-component system, chemotaxis family, sensor kinase CheA
MDFTRFHALFFSESADQLSLAEAALLALEKTPISAHNDNENRERINEIFRAVHSIKGSAGTLGFDQILQVAHALEEVFELVRKQILMLTANETSLAFSALDLLSGLIADARDGTAFVESMQIDHVLQRLEAISRPSSIIAAVSSAAGSAPQGGQTHYIIQFTPHASFAATGNDPILYLRELSKLGSAKIELDSTKLPLLNELTPNQVYVSWNINLVTDQTEAQIRAIFEWVEDICDLTISVRSIPAVASRPVAKEDELPVAKRSPTIHVRADRLDNLINQLGELAISQSYLKSSVAAFGHAEVLNSSLLRLERQVRQLQDTVLGLRMLPLKVLFGRFERVVRDAANELGKSVQLQIEGAQTELDKNLIEKLVDPLTHLVRNALDHGIDSPEQRLAQKKSATGTLTLNARHEAGSVILTVKDDGRGIDPQIIRARALELGLAKTSDNFDNEQWLQFIYRPGFSTTRAVSQWSGRGVGLDVVQQTIRSLGGDLYLRSQIGQGTSFHIRVPLTLAILDALMIKVGGQTYALPLTSVRECITRNHLRLTCVSDCQVVGHVGEKLIGAVNLATYLESGNTDCEQLSPQATFVHVYSGPKSMLLGVEEVLGQDQIVVRSLEKNFRNPGFANGATLLGNGAVALILDVIALVRRVKNEPVPQL